MHSSYIDDVDATVLKTELQALKQVLKENTSQFENILRALEDSHSHTRLLFPNVIIVTQLLLTRAHFVIDQSADLFT